MSKNKKKIAMVLTEGSFDKAMMPFLLGVTASASGIEAHIFFTFWGINVIKKGAKPKLPGMWKPFTGIMIKKMKKKNIATLDELLEQARELGVKLYACSATMELMSIKKEDLIDGVEVIGAAGFLKIAAESDIQLFIG